MINPLAIKTLFEYHYGMYDPIWDIVEGLSREQFVEETDYSLGSVRNQLLHVMEVDNRWLARLQSLPLPALLDENDYPDQATSRLAWDLVRKNVLQYTMALRPDELEEVVELSFPARGGKRHNSRWQILLHVVNHGTDHRAQILARLHELGARTLEQDLMLYLWASENS